MNSALKKKKKAAPKHLLNSSILKTLSLYKSVYFTVLSQEEKKVILTVSMHAKTSVTLKWAPEIF